MKCVFEASNGVEAHMIKNLLLVENVESEVFGEHLQGAIGDLQAFGMVRVMVSEQDYPKAHQIITDWEGAQPAFVASESAQDRKGGGLTGALIGFFSGVIAMVVFFQSSVEYDGVDHDGDGKLDEHFEYLNGHLRNVKIDRNRDGKIDLIYEYTVDGRAKASRFDNDFDARFETHCSVRKGNTDACRSDVDGDGFYEHKENYLNDVLSSVSFFDPVTKKLKKKKYYSGAALSHADIDLDGDQQLETRHHYDEYQELSKKSTP